jgi:hypothetical protein
VLSTVARVRIAEEAQPDNRPAICACFKAARANSLAFVMFPELPALTALEMSLQEIRMRPTARRCAIVVACGSSLLSTVLAQLLSKEPAAVAAPETLPCSNACTLVCSRAVKPWTVALKSALALVAVDVFVVETPATPPVVIVPLALVPPPQPASAAATASSAPTPRITRVIVLLPLLPA